MADTIRKNNWVEKVADNLVLIAILSNSDFFNLKNNEMKFHKNSFKI
jgi:hypothetical protein